MNEREAIRKLRNEIRLRHMALSTERTYCHWLRKYCRFLSVKRDTGSSRQRIESFLSSLAHRDVSSSTQNQAFNAILFFYKQVLQLDPGDVNAMRAKRSSRVRTAPSERDIQQLLLTVKDVHQYPTRLIVHILYGCGLRVNEPLNLRLKDVDFEQGQCVIRDGKHHKDRVVPLPECLTDPIRRQVTLAVCLWERDRRNGIPVPLPNQLERKYPSAAHSRPWYWLFPAHKTCRHPRTGKTVRWRCHESNVQRAVRQAARAIGADTIITPHVLRHAYATHALNRGENIRNLQAALGHKHLETTMGYVTPDALHVRSPLDPRFTNRANALQQV